EQVGLELGAEVGVVPAQPLEHHGGVLLLLVAVMREDGAQLLVLGRVHALAIPVDGLELFLQRDERAMPVDRPRLELPHFFVKRRACASHVPSSAWSKYFSPGDRLALL